MKRYNTPHRSRVVKTRMTEEEYAEFAQRLSACNMSQAEFIRQAITGAAIEVKTVEVKSPFASSPDEAEKAPKAHRLTAEEKEIKAAVMDTLKGQIAYNNDGMRASYRASNHSFNLLARNGVRIEGNTVTQNGEPLFKIHRRHAARKTQGCYRELMPTLEYVKQEQKQEKPSIRDQLRTAAKQQPEKKSPVKSKTHDMEL